MKILFFGTYDAGLHPRVAVLRDGLASHAERVDECNVPLGASTSDKVGAVGGVVGLASLALRVLGGWVRLIARSFRHRRPEVVVVGYMGHFDVLLARVRYPRSTVVLDHLVFARDTLEDRNIGSGVARALAGWLDLAAIAVADIVVVDTEEHGEQVSDAARAKTVVVPVGVTDTWFHEPTDRSGPMSVIFFGLYTPLQGATVIGEAITRLRGEPIRFTMVGTGQDYSAVRDVVGDRPEVTWIDWVDGEDLPGLVAAHSVCLGVFGATPKARRIAPTKAYQGMAAGCLVVTSDTVPQRRMFGETVVYVPAGDAQGLEKALRDAQARDLSFEREASYEWARRHFVPDAVVGGLVEHLAMTHRSGRRR